MKKLQPEELKTRQQCMGKKTMPVAVLLERIRSIYNVGSFFRTADGAGVEKVFLCGWTAAPPRKEITKTALGAEESVPWQKLSNSKC